MNIFQFGIPFFLILMILYSCNSPTKEITQPSLSAEATDSSTADSSLVELSFLERRQNRIDSQLALGIRKDTVILDFRFGMTKKQVIRQMHKQLKAGKIVRRKRSGNKSSLVYQLPLDPYGKVDCYFDLYYDKGRLSKIDCYPRLPKNVSKEDIFAACIEIFELKYGAADLDEGEGLCPAHYWISANRQIEIGCTTDKVIISYFDLSHKLEDLKIEPSVDPKDLDI